MRFYLYSAYLLVCCCECEQNNAMQCSTRRKHCCQASKKVITVNGSISRRRKQLFVLAMVSFRLWRRFHSPTNAAMLRTLSSRLKTGALGWNARADWRFLCVLLVLPWSASRRPRTQREDRRLHLHHDDHNGGWSRTAPFPSLYYCCYLLLL